MTTAEEHWDAEIPEPYQIVEVQPHPGETNVPEPYVERILVDTVHDGGVIPSQFRIDEQGRPRVDPLLLRQRYAEERDWGANLVAKHLAAYLGIPTYGRVHLARVLLDFNRFPGTTPPATTDPLARMAINEPFASALDHPQKMALLEEHYDAVSDGLEDALLGRLIKIGVHTYDEHNPSKTRRPEVSLLTRTDAYQRDSRMSYGVFDPMYPDMLGESTCSRTLRDRISLNLERAGIRTSHNHPYLLPEGCVEVRSQVWYFFLYVRNRFEAVHPETREDPSFRLVWNMLLNTNQRLQESEILRGFLHRYRRPPAQSVATFRAAQVAYEKVHTFVRESSVVSDYRRSSNRTSSIVIEVRKDLVCERRPGEPPTQLFEENAARIAKVIAHAITIYLETDRQAPDERISQRIQRSGPRRRGRM